VVAVIGRDGEPTASLLGDLQRLSYRPELFIWPSRNPGLQRPGPRPLAVLLDLRVLGADTQAVCQAVRSDRRLRAAPMLAVVPEGASGALDLSLGFDDLTVAPYRLSDLAARLRLLRWKQDNAAAPAEAIRAGRLLLDPATYQVTIDTVPVDLTLKEYQLLLFLLRNPNRVFDRAQLLDHVWGGDYYGGTRTVDVHIRRLRAKTAPAGDLIETVRGVGYRLALPQ
jgi:DNA-binding response OmpR family regulator